MKKFLLYISLFLFGTLALGQEKKDLKKEFDELCIKFRDTSFSSDDLKTLAATYLQKAKKSNENIHLGRGYYLKSLTIKDVPKKLQWLDTVIAYTKDIKNDTLFPMQAYSHKGHIFFMKNNYVQALDAFIAADSLAKRSNNIKFSRGIKFNIGFLKRFLGQYEDAEKLFLECKAFEENREKMYIHTYINILFQLSSVYFELGKIEASQEINVQGIQLTKAHNFDSMYYSFVSNEGINLSAKKLYKTSIDSLEKAYPHLNEYDKNIINFYLGKSYYELGNKEKGLDYFKKIDTFFNATNDLFYSTSPAYLYLINDSKERKDKEMQLYYTNQLLRVDTILNKNYRSLSGNITKKYDVPRLMAERDEIIEELEEKNIIVTKEKKWILKISIVVCVIAIGLFLYYYRLKRVYEKRYQAIIASSNKPIIEEEISSNDTNLAPTPSLNIDEAIINETLQALEEFEKGETYLTNQISLKDVAKILNTNSKYLSKIINTYKGKNFTTYINDLRVDYFINHVQTETKYQKYTIRAIAEEIGFSNPEGFSRAFQKKTGLKPSYFIRKVRGNT